MRAVCGTLEGRGPGADYHTCPIARRGWLDTCSDPSATEIDPGRRGNFLRDSNRGQYRIVDRNQEPNGKPLLENFHSGIAGTAAGKWPAAGVGINPPAGSA